MKIKGYPLLKAKNESFAGDSVLVIASEEQVKKQKALRDLPGPITERLLKALARTDAPKEGTSLSLPGVEKDEADIMLVDNFR